MCLCFSSFTRILYSILISWVMSTFGKGSWLTGLKRHISPTACFYNWSHSSLRHRPPYASTFFFLSVFVRGPLHVGFQYKFQIYEDSSKNSSQHTLISLWTPLLRIHGGLRSLSSVVGVKPITVIADVYWVFTICQALCWMFYVYWGLEGSREVYEGRMGEHGSARRSRTACPGARVTLRAPKT